jgi:uncharacterized repeat protein (TIGR02543 family)
MTCQKEKNSIPEYVWSSLIKVIPALRYLKAPVFNVSELYEKYPDGADTGCFALVVSKFNIYIYDNRDKHWHPIFGINEAPRDGNKYVRKDGEWVICDCGGGSTEPTTYWNVAKSGTAVRNNCPSGQSGSSVTYTVAAHTHSSTVSQAAADALAQADVDANKQAYANTNGSCTVNPPTSYTVTYYAQGGVAVSGSPFTAAAGSSHTIRSTTRSGFTLDGWATSSSGAKVYDIDQVITVNGNISLYAKWMADGGGGGTTYEVAFNPSNLYLNSDGSVKN